MQIPFEKFVKYKKKTSQKFRLQKFVTILALPHRITLTLSFMAKVIYDLDFLKKDCSKSFDVKNFWKF
jgi:ssDNA-specific exonuclease RecJ